MMRGQILVGNLGPIVSQKDWRLIESLLRSWLNQIGLIKMRERLGLKCLEMERLVGKIWLEERFLFKIRRLKTLLFLNPMAIRLIILLLSLMIGRWRFLMLFGLKNTFLIRQDNC